LRGINVGGNNKLPMGDLRKLLENLGLHQVQTYIASGNVVFQGEEQERDVLEARISAAIKAQHGFEPRILILERQELESAVRANPFPDAVSEPKTLHLYFLTAEPESPDLEALAALKTDNERFELKGKLFYLNAPDGIGRSKLAEKVDRYLGVATTARNWRTVETILEMVSADD